MASANSTSGMWVVHSVFQTKSRGGWKDHLRIGRTIGVFLSQQLKFALDDLY
jgi:hypothetical protein